MKIRTLAGTLYKLATPLAASVPPIVSYRIAVLVGDLEYVVSKRHKATTFFNLEKILAPRLNEKQRRKVARDFFRLRACEALDEILVTRNTSAFMKLVSIRGKEHIDKAREEGKGAILANAHFGSIICSIFVIGMLGYPVTVIAKWSFAADRVSASSPQSLGRAARITRNIRRNINTRENKLTAAVQAAAALRMNELVFTNLEAPVSKSDRPRAILVPFITGEVLVLPGAVLLSRSTGAPILITLMHRSPNYRNQTLEISPPLQLSSNANEALRQCMAEIEKQILQSPAHWVRWDKSGTAAEHT